MYVADAAAPVLVVEAPHSVSRSHGQRLAHLIDTLARSLIEAEHRWQWVVGLFVEIQEHFHAPDKLRAPFGRDHPSLTEASGVAIFECA